MANRRRGLPTKRKAVTRVTKSGKLSLYQQNYHVNPFNKSKKTSGKEKAAKTNTTADKFAVSMSQRPKSDKRKSIKDFSANLTPVDGQIGSHSAGKLVSKVKTKNDVNQLRESFFDPILSEGFFNSANISKYKGLLRDTTKVINNMPQNPHSYNQVVQSILQNKDKISHAAMVNISSSFQNHQMFSDTLRKNVPKAEAYDREEFLHEYHARHINPMGQLGSFMKRNLTEPMKASVQSMYGLPNDMEYISNVPTLTKGETKMWEMWIDKNNEHIQNNLLNGTLFRHLMLELDPTVAGEMFKSDRMIDIPIYQSTVMNLVGKKNDTNLKVIKEFELQNDTNFVINSAKFVIDDKHKVYLSLMLEVSNLQSKDFVSVSNTRTEEFVEAYNNKTLDILSDTDLSRTELKSMIVDETKRFKSINDDSFIIVDV